MKTPPILPHAARHCLGCIAILFLLTASWLLAVLTLILSF